MGMILPATMADIKAIETSIGSTIDAKFLELQNLILALKEGKDSPQKPPLEDPLASNDGDSEEVKEKKKRDEEEKLKNSSKDALKGPTSTSSAAKSEGKDGDFHAVSYQYSLDPHVPHHRITPLGSPPPLDASAFTSWQHSMKSYFNSASIEPWRILQVGFKPVDPDNLTRREVAESQLKL